MCVESEHPSMYTGLVNVASAQQCQIQGRRPHLCVWLTQIRRRGYQRVGTGGVDGNVVISKLVMTMPLFVVFLILGSYFWVTRCDRAREEAVANGGP